MTHSGATHDQTERTTWRKFERLLTVMELLQSKERSALELAAYFNISKRSALRDIEDLKKLGRDIQPVGQHAYRLPGQVPPFRPVEALAVHAATRLLYHHAASRNRDYLLALDKLTATLPESIREVARASTVDFAPQLPDDRALEVVTNAWVARQYISFVYIAPGKSPERRELAVYFVEISRSNLAPYAIGFDRLKRGQIRTFKLSRMKGVTLLPDTYEIPPDFDPRLYLSDAWGVVGNQREVVTVTLRFAPEVAYRVLEGGYPNMTIESNDAQGLTVKVRAGTDNSGLPREFLPFVLGWSSRVEVLDPPNVRAHWLAEARAVLEQFGGETDSAARSDAVG